MIYFTCPEFPGVKSVFRHAESLGFGRYIFIDNILDVKFSNNDHVIFGAWHDSYIPVFAKLGSVNKNVKKSIFWTSSPGQMEMSPSGIEIRLFNDIIKKLRYGDINKLYLLSSELYEYILNSRNYNKIELSNKIEYFPAPFNFKVYDRFIDNEIKGKKIDKIKNSVGLFIPPGSNVRKNYFNQKIAVDMLGNVDGSGIRMYSNTGGMLRVEDYYKLLSQMVVNLQVTYTEAFNYQVAEALALGTISVVSRCIQENLELNYCWMVSNPDSATEIRDNIKAILEIYNKDSGGKDSGGKDESSNYRNGINRQRKDLKAVADKNNKILKTLLSNI